MPAWPLRWARGLGPWLLAGLLVAPMSAVRADRAPDGASLDEIEEQAEQSREQAEQLRDKADRLAEQVRAIKARSVAVARRAQNLESELTRIEETLASLEEERAAKAEALADRRGQLADTLAALQRIAVQPLAALAVSPASPLEVVRSAGLLEVAVPEIERRAAQLKQELSDLRALRREIERQRAALERTAGDLAQERQKLDRLMARKRELRQQAARRSERAAEQARELADQAADMRELMARLDAQAEARRAARTADVPVPDAKPAPPGTADDAEPTPNDPAAASNEGSAGQRPAATRSARSEGAQQTARLSRPGDVRDFPDSRSSLTPPARGELVTRYGERVERAGGRTRSRGVELATRSGAQVVAPYDGQVVYAGPFRGYGRILIIEHGGRYHTLLAGLERIDAVVGQWVLAGEPVGLMGGSGDRHPKLYLELRRGGQPVDPLPWLAQTGDKVRG